MAHYDLVMEDLSALLALPYSEHDDEYHDAGKFLLKYDDCSEEITVYVKIDTETHDAMLKLYDNFKSFGITMRYMEDGTPVLKLDTFPYERK